MVERTSLDGEVGTLLTLEDAVSRAADPFEKLRAELALTYATLERERACPQHQPPMIVRG